MFAIPRGQVVPASRVKTNDQAMTPSPMAISHFLPDLEASKSLKVPLL
jgi:hypothetical protein